MAFTVSSFTPPGPNCCCGGRGQDWILSFSALCLPASSPWLLTVSSCPELKWVQRGKVRGQKGLVIRHCRKLAPWAPWAWQARTGVSCSHVALPWVQRSSPFVGNSRCCYLGMCSGWRFVGFLAQPLNTWDSFSCVSCCGLLSPPCT